MTLTDRPKVPCPQCGHSLVDEMNSVACYLEAIVPQAADGRTKLHAARGWMQENAGH